MFITSKYAGYNRKGEQSAAGYFLILCQPKNDSQEFPEYQNVCRECGKASEEHKAPEPTPIHQCPAHGIMARLKARAAAKQEPVDADFQGIKEQTDCPDCIRHRAEIDALGCTRFQPISNSYKIRGLVRYVRLRHGTVDDGDRSRLGKVNHPVRLLRVRWTANVRYR